MPAGSQGYGEHFLPLRSSVSGAPLQCPLAGLKRSSSVATLDRHAEVASQLPVVDALLHAPCRRGVPERAAHDGVAQAEVVDEVREGTLGAPDRPAAPLDHVPLRPRGGPVRDGASRAYSLISRNTRRSEVRIPFPRGRTQTFRCPSPWNGLAARTGGRR
jgi:hypothetical protein